MEKEEDTPTISPLDAIKNLIQDKNLALRQPLLNSNKIRTRKDKNPRSALNHGFFSTLTEKSTNADKYIGSSVHKDDVSPEPD
jgi:hypothetical protein